MGAGAGSERGGCWGGVQREVGAGGGFREGCVCVELSQALFNVVESTLCVDTHLFIMLGEYVASFRKGRTTTAPGWGWVQEGVGGAGGGGVGAGGGGVGAGGWCRRGWGVQEGAGWVQEGVEGGAGGGGVGAGGGGVGAGGGRVGQEGAGGGGVSAGGGGVGTKGSRVGAGGVQEGPGRRG